MRAAHTWQMDTRELLSVLKQCNLTVSPASSLSSIMLDAPDDEDLVESPRELQPEQELALQCVAEPHLQLGLLLGPADEETILWHHCREGVDPEALVAYAVTPEGDHSFEWTTNAEISEKVHEVLQLSVEVEPGPTSIRLSTQAYTVFLGIVDWIREQTLESLLARTPELEPRFGAAEVHQTVSRSFLSGDWRWFGALGEAISPLDMNLAEEDMAEGLEQLASLGLVQRGDEGFTLTEPMNDFCTKFGAPLSFFSLHGFRPDADEGGERGHLSVVRGFGGLCLIEFQDLGGKAPWIRMREATSAHVQSALLASLAEWRRGRGHTDEEAREYDRVSGPPQELQNAESTTPLTEAPASQQVPVSRERAEELARALSTARESGHLSPQLFESLHRAFRGEDAGGFVWTVALDSGDWHYLHEGRWTPAPPPETILVDHQLLNALSGLPIPAPRPQAAPAPPATVSGERRCSDPACGKIVAAGKRFCTACGSPLTDY